MSWCGATKHVDRVIFAAETMLRSIGTGTQDQAVVDVVLRPFVRTVATSFRDQDWDCVGESDYYDRFGPELEGETDVEHVVRRYEEYADDLPTFIEWLDRWRAAGREVPLSTH